MKKVLVLIARSEATNDPQQIWVSEDPDKLADAGQKFFDSYDFKLVNGKPFDPGNDDGKTGGFDVFDNVKMHNGKVLEFMHAGGDGPVLALWDAEELR